MNKTTLISAIILAAIGSLNAAADEVLIHTVDPITGEVIYAGCPTFPECEPPMLESEEEQEEGDNN